VEDLPDEVRPSVDVGVEEEEQPVLAGPVQQPRSPRSVGDQAEMQRRVRAVLVLEG